jgi:hypothetical protein
MRGSRSLAPMLRANVSDPPLWDLQSIYRSRES